LEQRAEMILSTLRASEVMRPASEAKILLYLHYPFNPGREKNPVLVQ